MSKSRVAPVKKMTIPRLEMQAAVLATRLAESIEKEVTCEIDETYYWSDSKVVLGYIGNECKRFHTFIAVRVAEIHDHSTPDKWHRVPGNQNPADDGCRGLSAPASTPHHRWFQAPDFLHQPTNRWPDMATPITDLRSEDPEVKKSVNLLARNHEDVLPNPSRFSSWILYRRIVAWVMRFIQNVPFRKKLEDGKSGPLEVAEIDAAKILILESAQQAGFSDEYVALRSGNRIKGSSTLLQLNPVLDQNGVTRAQGRLTNADIGFTTKHPVILPKGHDVTRLVVTAVHVLLMHQGTEHTLNEVRQQYYIPKSRSTIKRLIHPCRVCKKRRVQPEIPLMADLPAARFDARFAFSSAGIDYFGPYEVRRFRKSEKRYGLLVTCMSTIAVHIEVSHSLDTDSFLLAFRRFVARRGRPNSVYSDNGTNLKAGEKELRSALRLLNQSRICDEMTQRDIQWFFNPPAASHMGGIWERLVSSVKRCMKVVAAGQPTTDEVIRTFLTEVEAVLNSRPLCYTDADDVHPTALTPFHFLLGRATPNLPPTALPSATSEDGSKPRL